MRADFSGNTIRQTVFVHIAGSEPGPYTFGLSKSSSAAGGIVAYSGVDPANPVGAHGGQMNAASASIVAPSITTISANARLVGFFGTAVLTTQTPPIGMAERFDVAVPAANQFKVSIGADDQSLGGPGVTGSRTAFAGTSGVNVGQLVELRAGGGGGGDVTPPTVTNRTPAANATNVAVSSDVTATFSEDVTGVSGTTFTLEGPGATPVSATVSYDGPSRTATLDPSADLAAGTLYTARLTSGITDTSPNTNALAPLSWTFTTAGGGGDVTPPTVTNRTPAANATNVAVSSDVTATFSEDVTGVSGTTFTLEGPGATPVSATVSYDGPSRTATLDPSADLAAGTLYTARLTSGITDTSPNTNALAPLSWTFTTAGGGGDVTPPTVTNRTPAANATNVAVGSDVTATFSEDVTGVSGTTFTLEGPGATPVSATVSYDGPSRTATLDPSADLAAGTLYTARLTSGITDTSPNTNALAPLSWTFTTAGGGGGGAIAFRAASSANNATATTLVLPKPSGVVAGDALLAAVAVRGQPAITPPAGWTLVRQDVNGTTMRQAVFVHIAGSEPGPYTFTFASAQSAAGGIVAYSGVDTSDPVDVHGGQLNAASTSMTAPSVTTTGPDRMLIAFFGLPALSSMTPPGGMTERYDVTVPSTNTYKVTTGSADQSVAATGATGTRVAVAANSAASLGQTVALRPSGQAALGATSDPTTDRTVAPVGGSSEGTTSQAVDPTPVPTPSPTPSPAPSPAPSPTASPTPAPAPSPTIEPTPSATPSPTAAPTPAPTPSPSPTPAP